MPINIEADDEQRVLRLRLERLADRYGHRIEVAKDGGWLTALTSVEGAAADNWPASPPLNDVLADSRTELSRGAPSPVLATGAAGQAYWSMALTRPINTLVFDHACRLSQDCYEFLGNTYDVLCPILSASSVAVILKTDGGNLCLRVFNDEAEHGSLRLDENRLVITPQRKRGKTQRWKYQVELQ